MVFYNKICYNINKQIVFMPDNKFELGSVPEQVPVKKESSSVEKIENKTEQSATENSSVENISIDLPQNNQLNPTINTSELELKKVENILSANMESIFLSMDSATQLVFKQKGEETARKIYVLVQSGKAQVKKIVALIFEWLRIIPKVNKHYLQQEAKIKAEEILNMYQNKK